MRARLHRRDRGRCEPAQPRSDGPGTPRDRVTESAHNTSGTANPPESLPPLDRGRAGFRATGTPLFTGVLTSRNEHTQANERRLVDTVAPGHTAEASIDAFINRRDRERQAEEGEG